MHVFEVKIRKERGPEATHLHWPEWWGDVYERVDVLAYQDEGLDEEGAICMCDHDTWLQIEQRRDGRIQELDEDEANAKGRAWRPQVTKINDERAVLLSAAKAAAGEPLTGDEMRALDPDDPTPGVVKSPVFDVARTAREKGGELRRSKIRPKQLSPF